MEDPLLWQLLLQLALIALNAVFACAEIALISMKDARIAVLAEEGNKNAVRLARLKSKPAEFLATIQVAITLSGFLGSAFAADNFSDTLTSAIIGVWPTAPVKTIDAVSVILITLILSYFTLVLGELVPKRLAMKKAEKLALGMASMITFISALFKPIVWLLTVSTNGILRLFGINPEDADEKVSEDEIKMLVDEGTKTGTIDADQQEIIRNVFEFDDKPVGEFATHRTEVSVLWLEEPPEAWEKTVNETRYTRYPICGDTIDDIVGILNVKEYYRLKDKSHENVMAHAVKDPYFIPETVRADVVFRQMKEQKRGFAVVLDEYGGFYGIVTAGDLLEQLVGGVEDEYHSEESEPEVRKLDSSTWLITGSAALSEVSEALGVALPEDEYETFGGLIFGFYGSVPDDGTVFETDVCDMHVKVTEIKEHRLEKAVVCVEEKDGTKQPQQ